MSMHVEWDTAAECEIQLLTAEEANEQLRPDEETTQPVLVLGGSGGGALAIEGSREEIIRFAERMLKIVNGGKKIGVRLSRERLDAWTVRT